MTLEYAGNRLRSVSDATAGPHYQGAFHFVDGADEDEEYRYDLNGNTVTDLNRGILSSRFDTAGHPARMDFADGSSTCWLYDDAGTKLRTLHRVASVPVAVPGSQGPALTETVTDYSAGFVYEDSLLTRINLDGAYLSYTGADGSRLSTPEYHFYLRDHLGNNRVDVAADGRICQVTDYYPYGLPMASSRNAAAQRWLFGGKELDRISGLDLYDFEARAYDPALARFTSHDAFEEKYPSLTPYLYCAANPLRLIDPDGNIVYVFGNGSDKVVAELQKAVGKSITITKDDNGQLTYERNTEGKLKGYAKRFAEAVEDANITVNLNTRDGNTTSTGDILAGGAFMGNEVSNNEDGSVSVVANQELNPDVLETMSSTHGKPGRDTFHELSEAYEGAKISMKDKISSPMSGVKGSVYKKAHNKAVPQSGPVDRRCYDENGNIVEIIGTGDILRVKKVIHFVTNRYGEEIILQTNP